MGNPARLELKLLVEAILNGDTKVVRAQLEGAKSVDVRLPQRKNRPARETPLMLAVERGYLPIIRLLISLGTNINLTNEYQQPSLLYAVRKNHVSAVKLLLKSGADPNLVMMDGDFVLREAATGSIDLQVCRSLLTSGADACMANRMGGTALHIAAFHGRADVAQLLIRAGANVNHRDRHGHGPLTCALSRNHKNVIFLLLENGADPRRQPEALGIAAWEGHLHSVKILIEYGWDIQSKSHQGRTPLQHARSRKHKSVISALIDAGAS